jgi:hypothetical protein
LNDGAGSICVNTSRSEDAAYTFSALAAAGAASPPSSASTSAIRMRRSRFVVIEDSFTQSGKSGVERKP